MNQDDQQNSTRLAWAGVISGAALWGTVGLFISPLTEAGFTTLSLAFFRIAGALVIALPFLWFAKPGVLKLHRWQDLSYFLLTGTVSLGLFQWCHLTAIDRLGMSLAVVLLYTAPAIVVVIARFLFNEPITPRKVLAIVMMIAGSILVFELPKDGGTPLSIAGLPFGLGAAFTFALYNVSSKFALQKYSVVTVTLYTFLFASIGLLPFANFDTSIPLFLQPDIWYWVVLLMVVPTLLAYGFYLGGLQKIESGRATLAAVMELLIAVMLGVIVAGEPFSLMMGFGIVLVFCSVLMISIFSRNKTIIR